MATVSANCHAHTQDSSASHPYTCNTCEVAFRNSDLQKGHMRSDWHRYNLKRRVATLPPISSEAFTEKVLQARASSAAEAERAGFQKDCHVCQKTYFSENSYRNHLGSQKHKVKSVARLHKTRNSVPGADDASSMFSSTFSLGDPVASNTAVVGSDVEKESSNIVQGIMSTGKSWGNRFSPVKRPPNPHPSINDHQTVDHSVSETPTGQQFTSSIPSEASSAPKTFSLMYCFFCNHKSPDVPRNVGHMEKTHGMFIPEKRFLVDLEGLLRSLQQRVQEYNECLSCGKVKSNVFAAQAHMRDTGHCRIPYTTEDEQLEIGEFYDFRSTYSDGDMDDEFDDDSTKNGGVKLAGKRAAITTNVDGEEIEEGEDDGWETDSSASSLDSADLVAVPAENHDHQYNRVEKHPHHSRRDSPPHHRGDYGHSDPHKPMRAVFYDEYELHLPNGKFVGHRSLNRYFRQNLREHSWLDGHHLQQLDIEDSRTDTMGTDGEEGSHKQQLVPSGRVRDQKRQLVTRAEGGIGMLGMSAKKKKEAKKAEQRGRLTETMRRRRNEWAVNKEGNSQKHYHYSLL